MRAGSDDGRRLVADVVALANTMTLREKHTEPEHCSHCAIILFLFTCPFQSYDVWLKSNFFGQKTMDVRRFDQISFRGHNSSLEGATKLNFAPFCSS